MTDHRHTPPYGNIQVLHPNGFPMFRTGHKKASWYLTRGLANEVAPGTIQLVFEPNGPGHKDEPFFISEKSNQCIVCGTEDLLTKHHVVPSCYKIHFPKHTTRVGSYDVLPLCIPDHEKYNMYQFNEMQHLAREYDAPVHGVIINQDEVFKAGQARREAISLLKHGDKIPEYRRKILQDRILEYVGHLDLQKIIQEPTPEPIVVTHGQLVVSKLKCFDDFAIRWRGHFVTYMQPKNLPAFWEIDKRIYSNPDPEEARQYEQA